jgi:O-antigen ligase
MSSLVKISFLFYLGTLAITQTVYGGRLMNLRWVTLSILLVVAGWYWLIMRPQRQSGLLLDKSTRILLLYFLSTFFTVIFAENPLFSGSRWASHAMMLIIFLVFLRQNLTMGQIQKILVILKIIIGLLLVFSILNPAPQTIYDDFKVFRGAMANANTMGQIAAIGVVIYFHSFLIARNKRIRYLEAVLACGAIGIVWWTGSRSAMISLMTGIALIFYFYRQRVHRKVFWGIFLFCLVIITFPTLPGEVKRFVSKTGDVPTIFSRGVITKSRSDVWSAAWKGFGDRPVLGWGFGADSSIPKDWTLRLTALGIVERDAVNDFLFMLEGCGVVGFGAYLLLVYIVWRQKPTRRQVSILRLTNYSRLNLKGNYFTMNHAYAIMFTLAVSLLVLVQFDNTALSAGNFISVILWLSVGAAGALRKEFLLNDLAMYHYLSTGAQRIQKEASVAS